MSGEEEEFRRLGWLLFPLGKGREDAGGMRLPGSAAGPPFGGGKSLGMPFYIAPPQPLIQLSFWWICGSSVRALVLQIQK